MMVEGWWLKDDVMLSVEVDSAKMQSLSGLFWRSFHPFQWCFAVVPMILYPPKVSSERVVDAIGSTWRWRRNECKMTSVTEPHTKEIVCTQNSTWIYTEFALNLRRIRLEFTQNSPWIYAESSGNTDSCFIRTISIVPIPINREI